MSTLFGQLDKFSEQLSGITTKEFQVMLSSGYFPLLNKALRDGLPLPDKDDFSVFLGLSNLFPDLTELTGIVIPDDATIETLKSAGEYDSQSGYAELYLTSEHFKVTVHGSRNLFLAHFKRDVTSEQVEVVAKYMGYELAVAEDLLSVGAHSQHRELQRKFSIIVLGSSTVVDGMRCVPCLGTLRRWTRKCGRGRRLS